MIAHKTLPSLNRRVPVLFAALALICVNLLVPGAALAAGPLKKFDRALNETRQTGSTAPISVIVRTIPGQRAAVRDRLKARGGVIESEVVGLDAITVKLSPSQFDAMASDQAIATVSVNSPVSAFGASNGNQAAAGGAA